MSKDLLFRSQSYSMRLLKYLRLFKDALLPESFWSVVFEALGGIGGGVFISPEDIA